MKYAVVTARLGVLGGVSHYPQLVITTVKQIAANGYLIVTGFPIVERGDSVGVIFVVTPRENEHGTAQTPETPAPTETAVEGTGNPPSVASVPGGVREDASGLSEAQRDEGR